MGELCFGEQCLAKYVNEIKKSPKREFDSNRSANRRKRTKVGKSAETILKSFFKKDFKRRNLVVILGENLNSDEK